MNKELEKLYYLLTEAITNSDGTNKPDNRHINICFIDLKTYITEQEKKDERNAKELELYKMKEQQLIYDAKIVLSQSKRKELLEEYFLICKQYYICGIETKEQLRREFIEKALEEELK